MPQAKRRSQSSTVSRARAGNRRRDRAAAAAHRRQSARRRQIAGIAGLCLACVLLGGATGALLARGGALGDPAGSAVAIALSDESRASATDPVATDPVAMPERSGRRRVLGAALATADPDAGETIEREAAEDALARLHNAPLETASGEDAPAPVGRDAGATRLAALPGLSFPNLSPMSPPPWQRFAAPMRNPDRRPMIAVVLDDLGLDRNGAWRAIALPPPLTLAFMTYAENLEFMAAEARAAGHELLLHVPMEPRSKSYDPGPNVLSAALPSHELTRRLDWGFGRLRGFVGINNHMGSRFTASPEGMATVMRELRARGLLFLDSLTAPSSVGAAMARRAGVPYAQRDVFLDNDWNDRAAIRRQLAKLEAVARRRGYAVGIGHPHRATLDVLSAWLSEVRARGFVIVPVSAIVRHRVGIAQHSVNPAG